MYIHDIYIYIYIFVYLFIFFYIYINIIFILYIYIYIYMYILVCTYVHPTSEPLRPGKPEIRNVRPFAHTASFNPTYSLHCSFFFRFNQLDIKGPKKVTPKKELQWRL